MRGLKRGRYHARIAETAIDLHAAQALRSLVFRGLSAQSDDDAFDAICKHILVEDAETGLLVCCFRLLSLSHGRDIDKSYAAQYYELSALHAFAGPIAEMGRFCMHPDHTDPDILRVAWGAITRFVDDSGVELLFGCSSFHGTEADVHRDAFAILKEHHLAPPQWQPKVKAPQVFRFADRARPAPDRKTAMLGMPPLLKTYLMMGGWVSDHAVVDPDLNTLHVFTGLEVKAIPPARARALRAVAG